MGCNGAVVYGARPKEIQSAFVRGATLGAATAGAMWISAWGVSSHAFIAAGVGAMLCAMAFILAEKRSHAGHVRTYRRAR